jgi:hypothetical protein
MDRQYVGIDFHGRHSVMVRLSSSGECLGVHRVRNDALEFAAVIAEAGAAPMATPRNPPAHAPYIASRIGNGGTGVRDDRDRSDPVECRHSVELATRSIDVARRRARTGCIYAQQSPRRDGTTGISPKLANLPPVPRGVLAGRVGSAPGDTPNLDSSPVHRPVRARRDTRDHRARVLLSSRGAPAELAAGTCSRPTPEPLQGPYHDPRLPRARAARVLRRGGAARGRVVASLPLRTP